MSSSGGSTAKGLNFSPGTSMEEDAPDVPGFGKYGYGTVINLEHAEKFMDIPGFGDSYTEGTDTLTTPPRFDDMRDDATSLLLEGTRYRDHLGGDFELELGMMFDNANTFRKAIKLHAIKRGTSTVRKRNTAKRIVVGCRKECGFLVVASRMNRDSTFVIRRLQKDHHCDRSHYTKDIGKHWVCENFIELLRAQGNLKPSAVTSEIRRMYEFNVSKGVIHEGLKMAKDIISGDRRAEFSMARDYVKTLLKYNPGSTTAVQVNPYPSLLRPRFERMHVSLEACIRGFRNGCRPFIALDGCFLKGPDGGFLLCAVSMDANDQLFPIAYAWVEAENGSSWRWFLEFLAGDIGNDRTLSIISDRQKGLRKAVDEILPGSEHRFCVRHIHDNMKARNMGDAEVRKRLWSAACAYTEHRHKWHMDMLKKINKNAWDFLTAIDTKHWCRYQFRHASKTGLLVNNIAESFNNMVLEARDKPVISMMEWIRRKLMLDYEMRRKSVVEAGEIGKMVLEKLKIIKSKIGGCRVIYATEGEYEVDCGPSTTYKVNINEAYCSCMAWQLTGLPCSHVVACLAHERKFRLAPYCDPVYHKEAYSRTYAGVIHALPGREDWEKSDTLPIDPPVFKRRTGRPKKKRERSEFEVEPGQSKLGKRGLMQHCSLCGQRGHNKRSCHGDPGQTQEAETNQDFEPQPESRRTESMQAPEVHDQPESSRRRGKSSKVNRKLPELLDQPEEGDVPPVAPPNQPSRTPHGDDIPTQTSRTRIKTILNRLLARGVKNKKPDVLLSRAAEEELILPSLANL